MLCKKNEKNCINATAAHPIVRGISFAYTPPSSAAFVLPCLLLQTATR